MKIYLIDGNSYIYRAFHAVKDLTTSTGMPTNAIYGFTNMLFKFLREIRPEALAVVFDSPGPTKRHKLYRQYKAQRPETPNALLLQIPYIRQIVRAMNIPSIEMEGQEADDVIASLARRAASEGHEVFIVSADKDMLQVVDERIRIYDPLKDRVIDGDGVMEKLGIPPERVPEFMALTGDAIDNIPGVRGIGEKTAMQLLKERSLWDYMEHPELIPRTKVREAFMKERENLILSYELARLDETLEVPFDEEGLKLKEPDWSALVKLFRDLEFQSLINLIPPKSISVQAKRPEDISELNSCLSGAGEAVYVRTLTDQKGIISLGLSDGNSYFVFDLREEGGLFRKVPLRDLLGLTVESCQIGRRLVGFDLKDLFKEIKRAGLPCPERPIDLKVLYWLWRPQRSDATLQELALEVLGERFRDLKDLLGRGRGLRDLGPDELREFMAEELFLLRELETPLLRVVKQEDLWGVYEGLEMGLIEVLAEMENQGIRLQKERFQEALGEVERQLKKIEEEIYRLAGERFNPNSPRQLARVLYEKLGLRPKRKTKRGYSTDVNALQELRDAHPIVEEVLKWRSLSKMKNTYLEPILQKTDPRTCRPHTTFVQTGTATGRLSSREPNLQNIPVKGPLAERIRDAFVPEDGFVLLSADYSQIELRVLAHLSQDQALREAFLRGRDIHAETASKVFGVPEDEVSPEMRRMAKTVNFGIVYGISAFGLSEATGTGLSEAQEFIERYFETFPKVREFAERMVQEARLLGYVKSLFGRKRPVPELRSSVPHERASGERVAINTPVQATAADIMKLAMLRIYEKIKRAEIKARLLLQVHDELLFEVPEDEVEEVSVRIKETMEKVVELSVPLVVDISWGRSWAEAKG